MTVASDDSASQFELILAEQGITLSDEDPPAALVAEWVAAAEGATETGDLDGAILVAAPPERVEALIAAIRNDRDAFTAVEAGEQDEAEAPAALRSRGSGKPVGDDVPDGTAWRLAPPAAEQADALAADTEAETPAAAAATAGVAENDGNRVLALFVLRREATDR